MVRACSLTPHHSCRRITPGRPCTPNRRPGQAGEPKETGSPSGASADMRANTCVRGRRLVDCIAMRSGRSSKDAQRMHRATRWACGGSESMPHRGRGVVAAASVFLVVSVCESRRRTRRLQKLAFVVTIVTNLPSEATAAWPHLLHLFFNRQKTPSSTRSAPARAPALLRVCAIAAARGHCPALLLRLHALIALKSPTPRQSRSSRRSHRALRRTYPSRSRGCFLAVRRTP